MGASDAARRNTFDVAERSDSLSRADSRDVAMAD